MKKSLLKKYIKESVLLLKEDEGEAVEAEDEGDSESELNAQREITFGELQAILGLVKKKNWTKNVFKAATRFASSYVGNDIISKVFPDGVDNFVESSIETGIDTLSAFVSKAIGEKFDIRSAMSPEKFLAKIYGINDKPGLEKITLDDAMSNLIDDKVEGAFMIYLYKEIAKKDPNEVIPDDYAKTEIAKFTPMYKKTQGTAPVEV